MIRQVVNLIRVTYFKELKGNVGRIQVEMEEFRDYGWHWDIALTIQCFHRGKGVS